MSIKTAYDLACQITKKHLMNEISSRFAAELFAGSKAVRDLPQRSQDIVKIALCTLLRFSEFPIIQPTITIEHYIPQIRIPNPKVARGFSIVTIDSSQARTFVLADARAASLV